MYLKQASCGPIDTNCTLVADEFSKDLIIFDTPSESFEWIKRIVQEHSFVPKAIFLTHSHWDHIGDLFEVHNHFKIPVYVHEKDAANVLNPGKDGLPMFYAIPGCLVSSFLSDLQDWKIGPLEFRVIETPGHSRGSVVFHFSNENILISGDTLFKGTCGRVDLPTSNPQDMVKSLKKLSLLPEETIVYPGHGPSTSIKNELRWLKDPENFF